MMNNKCFVAGLTLLLLPQGAWAVQFVEQPDVFTPDELSAPTADATYYGTLTDWPHTFAFSLSQEAVVQYTVAVAPEADPVSLLLVREVARGVEEVVRVNGQTVDWQPTRDARLRLALTAAPTVETTLAPGRYRLEVSNPVNQGRYQLMVGVGSQAGFFGTIRDTFAVHNFYGHWVSAIATWRVLLLFVILGVGVVWGRRWLRSIL